MSQPLRRTANYPPSIWHDSYVQSLPIDFKEVEHAVEINKLKEDVRCLLIDSKELLDQIELIDALQQLGVAYHFQEEIKNILTTIFLSLDDISSMIQNDLHATSLLFRLLRENGFHVSTSIFNSFKEEGGSFMSCRNGDIAGMLSLYEASFLAVEGEDQLDEARAFATEHLTNVIESVDEPSLKEHVAYALELPLHWRVVRLHSRWFIDQYERKANMNPTLCRLAKLDFNFVQSLHKGELKRASRWWTDLGLGGKLGFTRDRLVENFLWTVGWAFEPKFSRSREAMTKANCMMTTIDDIYDVYGTLEELELFTEVVDRWDINAIGGLPEYMKTCFLALFNSTNDIAYEILNSNGVDIIPNLKRAWKNLCKAYLVEAKWYHSGYTPTLKEYMDIARISISGHLCLTHAYCTSEDITCEALKCYNFYLGAVCHSSTICRLCDDLATSTAEIERGDVPKAIQCYMHEHEVSEAVAREQIREMIILAWKKFNGEWIVNSSAPESFKSVAINIHRMAQCIYQYGDGYGKPGQETKEKVTSLLIEPIPI